MAPVNVDVCSKCAVSKGLNQLINCDSCKIPVCGDCSELSVTEMRCMQLKNRIVLYLCEECRKGLRCVPDLMRNITELRNEVASLRSAQQNATCLGGFEGVNDNEEVICEMLERNKRKKNVIILNMSESQKTNIKQIKEDDKNKVIDAIAATGVQANVNVFRLGRYTENKNRPIKVVFETEEDSRNVLKNKHKIANKNLKIFGDQTPMQSKYYKKIKAKLQDMEAQGDKSKTIKYIKGRPVIVEKKCHP